MKKQKKSPNVVEMRKRSDRRNSTPVAVSESGADRRDSTPVAVSTELQPEVPLGNFRTIDLRTIRESSTNPRRTFNEAKLRELASSVKIYGIQIPMKVRPLGGRADDLNTDGCLYELIAGARRFRAARMAGLVSAPCEVLTDVEDISRQIELQLVENADREDVHPMEEAQAYEALLMGGKRTIPELAEKTGRDVAHIYKRIALCAAIPEVRESFLLRQITEEHAVVIARLPKGAQMDAWRSAFETRYMGHGSQPDFERLRPMGHWRRSLDEHVHRIVKRAHFPVKDAALLPAAGACDGCAKRSATTPALFSDLEEDTCTDRDCWNQKVEAHVVRLVASGMPQVDTGFHGTNRPDEPGVIYRPYFAEIRTSDKSDKCDHHEKAVVVSRDCERGKVTQICRTVKCPVHGKRLAPPPEKGKPADSGAERIAKERANAIDQTESRAREQTVHRIAAKMAAAAAKAKLPTVEDARMIAAWMYKSHFSEVKLAMEYALGLPVAEKPRAELATAAIGRASLSLAMAAVAAAVLWESRSKPWNDRDPDVLADAAKRHAVDTAKIRAELVQAVNEKFDKRVANRKAKLEAEARKATKKGTKAA
jgi:ParB family chromosome partitioning protein